VLRVACCLQEVQTAQGQQLQLQGEAQNSSAGSYVVRDDTTVMQQVSAATNAGALACCP
jgi:hypothetical protein